VDDERFLQLRCRVFISARLLLGVPGFACYIKSLPSGGHHGASLQTESLHGTVSYLKKRFRYDVISHVRLNVTYVIGEGLIVFVE